MLAFRPPASIGRFIFGPPPSGNHMGPADELNHAPVAFPKTLNGYLSMVGLRLQASRFDRRDSLSLAGQRFRASNFDQRL